ncbi:MAG: helix-turn-helix transcriptional regulator [Proteobacteria bacterium]|nr:helix-turn-helix transcriptional regulator [Pseudomonadota bacterium]
MFKSLHSPENVRLVAWLKDQRENQGLTMRDLAKRLDTPHSFIGKVEQGDRRLDVIEYLQYCDALGVSPIEGLRVIEPGL